jgi:hypothetical protein
MHHLVRVLFSLTIGITMAGFGAFCVARPDRAAAYARRKYIQSSRLLQRWPFANMVMKGSYPAYLRWMGLFGLLFALVLLYATLATFSK